VRPLEFAHGRIVAEVETEEEGGALVGRLGAALSDTLELRSAGTDGETLLITVALRIPLEAGPSPIASPVEPTPQPSTR
jgi:hypothetical protein